MLSNSIRLLTRLDELLESPADITLYGRAALELGFPNPKHEYSRSLDVDIVLWMGQAEELQKSGNFWDALQMVNDEFAEGGLYISHLFEEHQVILSPDWKTNRVAVSLPTSKLKLFRLSDTDLLLSKLMRYDPTDLDDVLFIVKSADLSTNDISMALKSARIPDIPEIHEQFELCKKWLVSQFPALPK
ncbi:MAG: hypothetical protein JW808_06365 [Victivallales bacterium]|nr:hypothetical protein [Victivallales bacterium]